MDGNKIQLTEPQAEQAKREIQRGVEWLPIAGNFVNVKSISGIYDDEVERRQAKSGRLHDGTRVVKAFGQWKDADNPNVILSLRNYPELAKDEILTDDEWEREVKPLDMTEARRVRYLELVSGKEQKALKSGDK